MDQQQLLALAAAAIQNSGYQNPADWFRNWATGGGTDSGVAVNHTTALTYSTVFACVDIISSDVASLSLNDTVLDEDGNKTINTRSPVHWLLNHQPNENMTAFSFRKTLQSHVLLHGNGYATIHRDMAGVPRKLVPVHPTNVRDIFFDEDGRLWYEVNGIKDFVSSMDMLHVVGLSDDGICGYSVITKARNSWGLGLAEERHGSSHFKNGASPRVILKHPGRLSQEDADRLLEMWAGKQEGTENAGKTALAAGGLEIETVAVSNEDAQWLESRKFQRAEVASWFTMPEHMVNGERGPYNSTIAENQAYLRRTLKKHLCSWEQEGQKKLYPDRDRRRGMRQLRHDTSDILSSDPETKAKIAVDLVSGEVATRNEARRQLGMNRHDDPIADQLSSPNTRQDNAPSDTPEPTEEAVARSRHAIATRMGQLIESEARQVVRGSKTTKNFMSWIDSFYDTWTPQIVDNLKPIIELAALTTDCKTPVTEAVAKHVQQSKSELIGVSGISFSDNLADNVTETTAQWHIRAEGMADEILGTVTCTK